MKGLEIKAPAARSRAHADPWSMARRYDHGYAWCVFGVTSLGVLLTGLNLSALDVGLPSVSRHFHASASQASWFLLSYMLVNTVLILIFGRVADLVGRRGLYIAGLAVFTAASLACGLAPNASALIVWRAIQAVGSAAIVTNTTAQLVDVFPRHLIGLALGLNVTVISAARAAGPVVGGAFVNAFGWQWVFLFNVPFGVVGLVLSVLVLRGAPVADADSRFDVPGAVLAIVCLTSLVFALAEGGSNGWRSPNVLVAGVIAVMSLPAFLFVQAKRSVALVDAKLLRSRRRAMAYIANTLLAFTQLALVLLASLFLQAAQGAGPFAAGLQVATLALGMMVVSPIAGRLVGRIQPGTLSSAGMLTVVAGLLCMATWLSPRSNSVLISGSLLAVGVGVGLFLPPNTTEIMATVEAKSRGVANGLRSMLQNTGGLAGTAMVLAIATGHLNPFQKRAAYAGTLSRLQGGELHLFVSGCRAALLVLAGLCALAAVASMLRGGTQESSSSRPSAR